MTRGQVVTHPSVGRNSCVSSAWQEESEQRAWAEGYEQGEEAGYENGRRDGYREGRWAGEQEMIDGQRQGRRVGRAGG
jgi:flagellar biosynthesis/type III secretory pathway protein FliH